MANPLCLAQPTERKSALKKFIILIASSFLLTLLVACLDNAPASPTAQETVMASVPESVTATAFPTPAPSPINQPSHEYLVYGVKRVAYAMSDYDANLQKIPLSQYIHEYTDIYSYSVEDRTTKIIFSDKDLPVFIMNSSGGGETAIHDIVAASPSTGRIYARMLPRDQYLTYQDAGGLYELSTDGTNQYKKLFNFDAPVGFVLSPDATKIASLYNNDFLVVRTLDSGNEFIRIDLNEFKDNWIPAISWAPDGKSLLMDVASGEASVTPAQPYSQTTGCYLMNIYDRTMEKLSAPLFQTPRELTHGFMTNPSSYAYFPRSNRLIGMAQRYDSSYYAIEPFSVDLKGANLVEIPIGHNKAVWELNISPEEDYLAYPCMQDTCLTHLQLAQPEVVIQAPAPESGTDQEQTVVGWLEK
jgi:hypothetical protein